MKNRQKIMYGVLGLLIGLFVSTVPNTLASTGTKTLQAAYRDIKLVVDDKLITPMDGNGVIVEPFVINGTTYLPVRAVAEALGKAVYWDGPTYTVYIGNMSGKLEQPTQRLKDAQNIGSSAWKTLTNQKDNYGNTYADVCESNSNSFRAVVGEYLLNMKYSTFRGTLFVPSGETSSDVTYSFEIIADDRVIYTSPVLDKTSAPVRFDVNVQGYNHIKIVSTASVSYLWGTGTSHIHLGDAGFYQ